MKVFEGKKSFEHLDFQFFTVKTTKIQFKS